MKMNSDVTCLSLVTNLSIYGLKSVTIRAVGNFSMVRGGGEWKGEGVVNKNFGHHGWPTTTNNNKNKPGQNALKQSQKKKLNLDQNINYSKTSYLEFPFYHSFYEPQHTRH